MKTKQTLSKWLSSYHPHPGQPFYQKMGDAPWNPKELKMTRRPIRPARLAWQLASGIILAAALLSLSIPGVRASLSAWIGLSVAPSNQAPASAVTLVAPRPGGSPTAAPTPTPIPAAETQPAALPASAAPTDTATPAPIQPSPSQPGRGEISQLSPQAGWDILAPGQLPVGYAYESAYLDTNHAMVILTYLVTRPLPGATDPSLTASKTITLLEALKNDFTPMQVAPATHVQDTEVNGQPAAFAIGAWDAAFVKNDKDPNGGEMVSSWRNDLAVKNLYWQAGKVFLVLVTDDEAVSQQELIEMAASVAAVR